MMQKTYSIVVIVMLIAGSMYAVAQTASSQPAAQPASMQPASAVSASSALPSASAASAPTNHKGAQTQKSQTGKLASESATVTPKQARTAVNSANPSSVKTTTVKSSK